ncbi:MAG: hypothetical protein QG602_2582 [Verrucomicrobiota bacterium]|nr:hypothetical protein [Verrucomicrobiota bacterium]
MRAKIAKVEVVLLPLLTVGVLAAPRFASFSEGIALFLSILFLIAGLAHVHGTVVLKQEGKRRLFWISCVAGIVWLGLSFAPIWFGHSALGRGGKLNYHGHAFWDLPHVH